MSAAAATPTPPAPGSAEAASRLRSMYHALLAAYGPQGWWPAKSPLEVIVGAYLTQNTAWKAVERSLANLSERGLLHLDGLRAVSEEELRELIRPSGFMLRKAAAIKAFIYFLDREFAGSLTALAAVPVERLRPRLLALPGVGEETADAILLYALERPVMVVDEYLRRIANRHALIPAGWRYADLQSFAASAFGDLAERRRTGAFNEFHALAVAAGKIHCGRIPRCDGCPLAGYLPAAETFAEIRPEPEPAPTPIYTHTEWTQTKRRN